MRLDRGEKMSHEVSVLDITLKPRVMPPSAAEMDLGQWAEGVPVMKPTHTHFGWSSIISVLLASAVMRLKLLDTSSHPRQRAESASSRRSELPSCCVDQQIRGVPRKPELCMWFFKDHAEREIIFHFANHFHSRL
jgi:hypothetical protein